MTVWATHGAVHCYDPNSFRHRNFLDSDLAHRFLSRCSRFVPLDAALRDEGDALTIDDKTLAAADLARIAITYGHAVTLFASGRNARDSLPYIFHQLNTVLDAISNAELLLNGRKLAVDAQELKSMIRRWIKSRFAPLATCEQQYTVISDITTMLGISMPELPSYLRPLGADELRDLYSIGVSIENHGWEHVDLSGCTAEAMRDCIKRGKDYLESELLITTRHFAVPFGEVCPPQGAWDNSGTWLLSTTRVAPGWLAKGVYNRCSLKIH